MSDWKLFWMVMWPTVLFGLVLLVAVVLTG